MCSINNKPKISIIIPMFKVQRYIRQCLESVLSQDYDNFECIIIDDGSPDRSAQIAKDTVGGDKRFRIISQPNKGVSSARNLGIDNATGHFIVFIDSDDYVLEGYLDSIADLVSGSGAKTDGLVFNHSLLKDNCIYTERKKYQVDFERVVSKQIAVDLFLDGVIGLSSCGMVFKRSILGELRFDTSVSVGEDALLVAHYLMRCSTLLLSEKSFYVYRQDSFGVTKSGFSELKLLSAQDAFSKIEALFLPYLSEDGCRRLYVFIFRHMLGHVLNVRVFTVDKAFFKYFFYVLSKIRVSDLNSLRHLLVFLYCKYWLRVVL